MCLVCWLPYFAIGCLALDNTFDSNPIKRLKPGTLTRERLHGELGLLGVHLVLDQRVDVGQHKLDLPHRGAQLPQGVRARVTALKQTRMHTTNCRFMRKIYEGNEVKS